MFVCGYVAMGIVVMLLRYYPLVNLDWSSNGACSI
uniref:Uncharacterized protein n=1 Tax=Arundo donax TaxID=35708 RepID=A0A0A9FSF9_ARUDO